ncbi:MAG: FAD-dependent oxidoreductase [Gammaproteobacteria bacterium]|nr:FAD-dependent oxidoreductase [Gammaproteobacteria bacterium]
MKRRTFIHGGLGVAGALSLAGLARESVADTNTVFDLAIIGAGTAGLPAALFAARRGARVIVFDRADDIGGTLHLANGQISAAGSYTQRAKGIVDSPQQHFEEAMRLSNGRADPNVVRLATAQATDTVNWLLDTGLKPLPEHPVTGDSPGRKAYDTPRYIWAKEEGVAILDVIRPQIAPLVAAGQITLRLRTRVTGLMQNRSGAIEGVRAMPMPTAISASVGGAKDAASAEYRVRARHVLLTSGGYAMNPRLFAELSGVPAYSAGSYPHALGDGLSLATAVGGVLRGHDLHRPGTGSVLTGGQFPATVYARFNTVPQRRLPWEIWVNNAGKRFIREDEPLTNQREQALLEQADLRYQIIFDQAILDAAPQQIPDWSKEKLLAHFNTHPMFHRAESLDELAAKTRIDAAGLRASVEQYNLAVARGQDSLGRTHLPRPIAQAPFYAVTHLGHSATSSVGVTVDAQLRVTRQNGTPIPNLYAAGEVLGSGATLGNAFVPGMMLTPALALGRWLGLTLPIERA